MQTTRHALWTRLTLGMLAAIILVFTLPAYLDPSKNPALAALSGEAASLGSVAGAFLGRQLTIALIALFGAVRGTTQPMLIGTFGMAFFNLHDAVFIAATRGLMPGAIFGMILGMISLVALWGVRQQISART